VTLFIIVVQFMSFIHLFGDIFTTRKVPFLTTRFASTQPIKFFKLKEFLRASSLAQFTQNQALDSLMFARLASLQHHSKPPIQSIFAKFVKNPSEWLSRQTMSSASSSFPFHPLLLQILHQQKDGKSFFKNLAIDPTLVGLSSSTEPGFISCFSYDSLSEVLTPHQRDSYEDVNIDTRITTKLKKTMTPYSIVKRFVNLLEDDTEAGQNIKFRANEPLLHTVEDILYSQSNVAPIEIHRSLRAWGFPLEPLLAYSMGLTSLSVSSHVYTGSNFGRNSSLRNFSPSARVRIFPIRHFSSVLKKRRVMVRREKRKRRRKMNRKKSEKNKV
jgi:hypothetical protein